MKPIFPFFAALLLGACGAAPDAEAGDPSFELVDATEDAVISDGHCSARAYVPTHTDGSYSVDTWVLGECDPGRSATLTIRLQKYVSGQWQTLGSAKQSVSGSAKYYGMAFVTSGGHTGTFRTQVLAFSKTDNSPSVKL